MLFVKTHHYTRIASVARAFAREFGKSCAKKSLSKLRAGCGKRVVEEHDDGHWAHTAWDGSDGGGDFARGFVINVADEAGIGAVNADVDDGGARFDHLGG